MRGRSAGSIRSRRPVVTCEYAVCTIYSTYKHRRTPLKMRTNIEIDDALMAAAQTPEGRPRSKPSATRGWSRVWEVQLARQSFLQPPRMGHRLIVVDSSVWIDFPGGRRAAHVEAPRTRHYQPCRWNACSASGFAHFIWPQQIGEERKEAAASQSRSAHAEISRVSRWVKPCILRPWPLRAILGREGARAFTRHLNEQRYEDVDRTSPGAAAA